MSSLNSAFESGRALICYLTAGDPSPEKSVEFIKTASKAGADIIEVGIPFSDPVAEGRVIERSHMRALDAGVNTETVFEIISRARDCQSRTRFVILTYINPVFVYGYERFFKACKASGVCGVIIPDLPFEERGELSEYAKKYDVDVITLIAPTTGTRITRLAGSARGFIYVVSSMGVTGIRDKISADLADMVRKIRSVTDTKIAAGFGISQPEQAKEILSFADGVIVGSAIVKIIEEYGENAAERLFDFVCNMKANML